MLAEQSDPRARLETAFAPDVAAAIEQLVADRVREHLEAAASGHPSPWLSLEEAADYLRVSPRTLERRIAKGSLRSTTIGRRRLLLRDDLDELANAAAREETVATAPPRRRRGVE